MIGYAERLEVMTGNFDEGVGSCYFCQAKVGEDCYCRGCDSYICDDCFEVECLGEHEPEAHKEE